MEHVNYRAFRSTSAALLVALGLALAFIAPVSAEEPKEPAQRPERIDPAKEWIPSFSLHSGVTVQEWKGSNSSVLLPGGSGPPEPIRPAVSGDDNDVTAIFGANLELMSPQLPIPTSPRFFVGAEVVPLFSFERDIAREGDAGPLKSPVLPGQSLIFDEDLFIGQGTRTTAEMQDVGWSAYLGMAFPVEIFDRTVRIKPSIGWMRYRVAFNGLVSDAACVTPFPPSNNCNLPTSSVRELSLAAGKSRTFHGVGPGLDVELETSSIGKLGSTIYLGLRAYRILTDNDIEFGTSQTYNDGVGTNDVATARFKAEVDDWMVRLVVGARLEWHGGLWRR